MTAVDGKLTSRKVRLYGENAPQADLCVTTCWLLQSTLS